MSFSDNGVIYDSQERKKLVQVAKSDIPSPFVIPASVEEIVAGSTVKSAFYECRNNMDTITFATGSKLNKLGDFVFSTTTVKKVDMSQCSYLDELPLCAFYSCRSLNFLSLPPQLKKIGSASIAYTGLTSLDIPDSLTTIADYHNTYGGAIANNYNLETINFGDHPQLNYIGTHCFMLTVIKTFEFPENVQENSIKGAPFYQTWITSFTLSPNHKYLSVDEKGWTLYNKEGTKIILVVTGITESYVIRSNVSTIGDQAFRNSQFCEIIFQSAPIISYMAFSACAFPSIIIPEGVTIIPNECFISHTNLINITLPSTLSKIDIKAFDGCVNLTNIILPNQLKTLGDSAFSGCASLTYLEIPASLENLGSAVFSNCNKNLNVTFLNEDKYKNIDGMLFEGNILKQYFGNDPEKELTIPYYCTNIPQRLFEFKQIKSISFEEGSKCTEFGEKAFNGCFLTFITLPSSLIQIGEKCFDSCTKLKEINFSNTHVLEIPYRCFYNCASIEKIIFDNSQIVKISESAFEECSSASIISMEESLIQSIGDNAFKGCGATSIYFPETLEQTSIYFFANTKITSIKFNTESNLLTLENYGFAYSSELETVEICDSIHEIKDYCFAYCPKLKSFRLGKNTSTLGMHTFQDCVLLSEIIIPEHSQLERFMPFVFSGCSSFNTITLEANDTFYFEDNMLLDSDKTKLIYYMPTAKERTLLLSSTISEIADYAFHSCENLYEVFIPFGNLKKIGFQSFKDCIHLTRLVLPSTVETISDGAFLGCNSLKCGCVEIPDEVLNRINNKLENISLSQDLFSDMCKERICYVSFERLSCNSQSFGGSYLSTSILIFLTSRH